MSKSGALIMVEDDPDDQELIKRALVQLKVENKVMIFRDGEEAWAYLTTMTEQPFMIFSDINMPAMDGITLKKKIDADKELRRRSIPFVYLTTGTNKTQLQQAYDLTVQGFFLKGNDFGTLRATIGMVVEYWKHARHPNE